MMTLEPRRIPLTEGSFRIYENVDGNQYGAVFDEWYAIDHRFMGDIWGFGDTKEDALVALIRQTEEYNALYYKRNLRFIKVY